MRKRAFTLLELLVVIAVIAVLAALLAPALGKARDKARGIQCASQLKNWNLALQMYAADSSDLIPSAGYDPFGRVDANSWAQVVYARDAWYNNLPPHAGVNEAWRYAPSKSGHAGFYSSDSQFRCPSAKLPADRLDYYRPYFSLAMNSKLIEPPLRTIQFGSILNPSRTVTFLDGRLEGEAKVDPAQTDGDLGQPGAFASRFPGARHGDGGNLAFADGHGERLPGKRVVETHGSARGFDIKPPRDVIWTPKGD